MIKFCGPASNPPHDRSKSVDSLKGQLRKDKPIYFPSWSAKSQSLMGKSKPSEIVCIKLQTNFSAAQKDAYLCVYVLVVLS